MNAARQLFGGVSGERRARCTSPASDRPGSSGPPGTRGAGRMSPQVHIRRETVAHVDQVKYQSEKLDDVELAGWRAVWDPSGMWVVSGPCPKCKGDAYGPDIPDFKPSSSEDGGETSSEQEDEAVSTQGTNHPLEILA